LEEQARALREALLVPNERRNRRDDAALVTLLAGTLATDSDCIDVGAHQGSILAHMIRLAPAGRHLAFEPHPTVAARLAEAFPTVDVRPVALSSRSGQHWFYAKRSDPATSGLSLTAAELPPPTSVADADQVAVPVTRLDDALPAGFAPAFIKVDVEGAEYEVFEGAHETLRRHQPVVAFEHSLGCRHYGREPGDVYELLAVAAGLRIFDIDGGGPYSRAEFRDEVIPPAAGCFSRVRDSRR